MGLISETFDIRVEVQAPVNGSEAYNGGVPSSDFSVVIAGGDAEPIDITQFFQIEEPEGKPVSLVSLWKDQADTQSKSTTSPTTKTCSPKRPEPRPPSTSWPNPTGTFSSTNPVNTLLHSPTTMDRLPLPSGMSFLFPKSQKPRMLSCSSVMEWLLL